MDAKLIIIHTNDIHNKLPGDFNLFTSTGHDLLFDAGDAIGGSNTVFRFNEPVLRKMSSLGYDAMALGNREFHYIRSIMRRRRKEAGFPILSANLLDITGKIDDIISPFIFREVRKIKIAILGLTVQILPPGSFWEGIMKFKFLDPLEVSRKYIKKLRKRADLIFILSHLGVDIDSNLARSVPGIDLIIGGHSHTPLKKPLKIEDTLIVQAGFWATSFGRIILNLKNKNNCYIIDSYSFKLVPIRAI